VKNWGQMNISGLIISPPCGVAFVGNDRIGDGLKLLEIERAV